MMHFSMETMDARSKQYNILNAESKLSTSNFIPSENIYQKLKGNKEILKEN